jgi:hypothetical protein
MSEKQAFATIGKIQALQESTRKTMALCIWLVVFVSLLFVNMHSQSQLMTAGFILQLTGAYSTFLLCGKSKYRPFVHGVPYALALAGAVSLCLAPNFPAPVAASLMLLALTVLMHWSVIAGMRKNAFGTGKTTFVSECLT